MATSGDFFMATDTSTDAPQMVGRVGLEPTIQVSVAMKKSPLVAR